jgi:hypothetical protein
MTRSFSGGSGVRGHIDNGPPCVSVGIRSDGLAGAEAVIVADRECPHCVAQAIQTKRSPDRVDQAGA